MDESSLKQCLEALKLEPERFNMVYALVSQNFDIRAALSEAHRSKSWWYALPEEERNRLWQIAVELNAAPKMRALQILEEAVPYAAEVQVNLLKSRDERVRQSASKEVLDRGVGKVTTPIDVTSNGQTICQTVGFDVDKM